VCRCFVLLLVCMSGSNIIRGIAQYGGCLASGEGVAGY